MLNVVQSQHSCSSDHENEPGAMSGNTSGSVRSYASGSERSSNVIRKSLFRAHGCSAATWFNTTSMHSAIPAARRSEASAARSSIVPSAGSTAP